MKIIRLGEIDSTNTFAKSHIEELDNCSIVHALHQTNGRGRLNRSWVDLGDDNLFFSIVLKPSQVFSSAYSCITQYASVVLCKVLEKHGVNPKVKWPNDVMIDGKRKISGILSETVIEHNILKGIVLGIGINLNATQEDVENVPDRVVTALNLETGCNVDMDKFLNEYLEEFFLNYDKVLEQGFKFFMDAYLERNCFLEKDIKIQVLNNVKSGYAKGLNENGELILQVKDNEELTLNIGDIL